MSKGLTLTLTADTPEELIELARRFAGAAPDLAFGARVVPTIEGDKPTMEITLGDAARSNDNNDRPLINAVADLADAVQEDLHEVHENAVTDLTPEDMVRKGVDTMMQLCAKDASKMDEVKRLLAKFGVKKLSDIAKERAAEFYQDTILLAAGTKEAA